MKIKENEKRDKYENFARELKKAMDQSGDGVSIVISVHGTIPEVLENGRLADIIPTIASLRSARILRSVLETLGDLLPLRLY